MFNPGLLHELLDDFDTFVVLKADLLHSDPEEFHVKLRGFVAYLISKSIREAKAEIVWREPSTN